MTAQPHNRFVFCVMVIELVVNGNQAKDCIGHPLTLKGLGFFLSVQHWGGGGCFPLPSVKLDPDIFRIYLLT